MMIKIDIRWSDIDANRHVVNSAYINFMSYARIVAMRKGGFSQKNLAKYNIGPIALYEHVYYFKEILPDEPIYITAELKGLSKDFRFFEFMHNIYDKHGENKARSEMMGAWIDLKSRKLTSLPEEFAQRLQDLDRTDDFKYLTKEDTRKFNVRPINIDPDLIVESDIYAP